MHGMNAPEQTPAIPIAAPMLPLTRASPVCTDAIRDPLITYRNLLHYDCVKVTNERNRYFSIFIKRRDRKQCWKRGDRVMALCTDIHGSSSQTSCTILHRLIYFDYSKSLIATCKSLYSYCDCVQSELVL
uniref:THAP-type domain-containing protein n=1 Tax=Heterorhabditis bacteriophora TaxID=37862 RepID=A0A1I7WT74_HETBA